MEDGEASPGRSPDLRTVLRTALCRCTLTVSTAWQAAIAHCWRRKRPLLSPEKNSETINYNTTVPEQYLYWQACAVEPRASNSAYDNVGGKTWRDAFLRHSRYLSAPARRARSPSPGWASSPRGELLGPVVGRGQPAPEPGAPHSTSLWSDRKRKQHYTRVALQGQGKTRHSLRPPPRGGGSQGGTRGRPGPDAAPHCRSKSSGPEGMAEGPQAERSQGIDLGLPPPTRWAQRALLGGAPQRVAARGGARRRRGRPAPRAAPGAAPTNNIRQ